MAIAYDSITTNDPGSQSSYSFNHTVTGSQALLLVIISIRDNANTVSGITYNGVALTKILSKDSTEPGNTNRTEIWGLANPATGTNSVAVTMSTTCRTGAVALSLTGVHQTSPYDVTASSASSGGGSGSTGTGLTYTTTANNAWQIDAVTGLLNSGQSSTPASGQTERADFQWSAGFNGGFTTVTTKGPISPPSSITMSETLATADIWSKVSVSIKPAPSTTQLTKSLQYYVKKTVTSQTKSLQYVIKRQVTSLTKSLTYGLYDLVDSVVVRWGTLTTSSLTKSLQYAIRITKTSQTKSLKYTIKAPVTNLTKSLQYEMNVIKVDSMVLTWGTVTASALTKSLKYTVKVPITTLTKSLKYTVKAPNASLTKSLQYSTRKTRSALTESLRYAVASSLYDDIVIRWGTVAQVSLTKSLQYTVKKTTAALTKSLQYGIKKTPSALTKSLAYSIRKKPSLTKSLQYTVRTTPALAYVIDESGNFVIAEDGSKVIAVPGMTLPLTYKIKAHNTSLTKSLTYRVRAHAAPITKSLKYTIKRPAAALTKSLTYVLDIFVAIDLTKSLQYAVKTTKGTPKRLKFNGSDSYATIPVSPSLTSFSFEFWYTQRGFNFGGRLIDWGGPSTNGGFYIQQSNVVPNGLQFVANNGSTEVARLTYGSVTQDVKQHIAVTYDSTANSGAGQVIIYLNGVEVSRDNSVIISNPSQILTLGKTAGASTNYGNFELDEFRMYNNAVLSAAQILADYNSGNGVRGTTPDSNLVAGYHFDAVYGSLTPDYSGNGNSMTVVNTTLVDGGVLTPVNLPLTYTVKSTHAAITKSLRYAVKFLTTNVTKSLTYRMNPPRSVTKSLKYTIKSTRPAITKSLSYRIRTVHAAITKSLVYLVTITQPAITKSLQYSIIGAGGQFVKALKYTIKTTPSSISKELTYVVSDRTKHLSKTLSLKYTVKPHEKIVKVLRYAILHKVKRGVSNWTNDSKATTAYADDNGSKTKWTVEGKAASSWEVDTTAID